MVKLPPSIQLTLPLVALEWGLFFLRPVLLSHLALVPVGTRSLPIAPRVHEALIARAAEGTDYRTPLATSVNLARLQGPSEIDLPGDKRITFVHPALVVLASKYTLMNKSRHLLRATLSVEEDRLVVRATTYPVGLLSMLIFFLTAILSMTPGPPTILPIGFVAVFAAGFTAFSRYGAYRQLDLIADEVSRRLAALDRPAP